MKSQIEQSIWDGRNNKDNARVYIVCTKDQLQSNYCLETAFVLSALGVFWRESCHKQSCTFPASFLANLYTSTVL